MFPSIRNIGMARRNAIAAGVKDERFTIVVLVLLDLPYKNNVITAVVLANFSAGELGDDTSENRQAMSPLHELDIGKLVQQRGGELSGQVMLMGFQYIDGEMSNICKIVKTWSLA